MSPRTEKQFKQMRETKKQLIIEASLELFAGKGYHATSISDIAKKACISKGLMYNYFSSKEDLLHYILKNGIENIRRNFDPNFDGILEQHELLSYIEQLFRLVEEDVKFWKFFLILIIQPSVMEIFSREFNKDGKSMLVMLDTYFRSRQYPEPELETLLFISLMKGIITTYITEPEGFPLNRLKMRILDIYNK